MERVAAAAGDCCGFGLCCFNKCFFAVVIVVVLCVAGNVGQFLSLKCSALKWTDSVLDSLANECISKGATGAGGVAAVLSNTFSQRPLSAPMSHCCGYVGKFPYNILFVYHENCCATFYFINSALYGCLCVCMCVVIFLHFCY